MTVPARLKDIPALAADGSNLQQWAAAMREAVQGFRGYRGDKLDKALTLRDLGATDFSDIGSSGAPSYGTGTDGPGGVPGTGPYHADPTPPPTPTGLVVTAGFSTLFISHDNPAYTVGHGHDRTIVYGKKWPDGDPLPVFSGAVQLMDFQGTFGAYPTELGTRWAIWIKWRSIDGVLSVAPAGGANGVVAQTGLVGNHDLGPLIIEAANLANMDFSNLIGNTDGSTQGASGWIPAPSDGTLINVFSPGVLPWWAGYAFHLTGKQGYYGQNIAVKPGDEFVFNVEGVPDGGAGATCPFGFGFLAYDVSGAYVSTPSVVTFPTGGAGVRVSGDTSYTVPVGIYYVRAWVGIGQLAGGAYGWFFSKASIRRKPTKLAINTIVAGDGAIANLAITNALVANAAIDDAKVANLSAAKLSVGTGIVGGPLMSANYVSGVSGWLVQPSGFAEFSNIIIRGAVYTGTIFANAGTIGGITIGVHDIRSTNYVPGTAGFRINDDGTAEFYSITAKGTITANILNAATGTFGAVTIAIGGSIRSGQSAYNTGSGFWLGINAGVPQLSIGNPAGEHLNWDGSHLSITDPTFGAFTASIPGGDINADNTSTVPFGIPTGTQTYATRSVSVSGGKAPYTYIWMVSNGGASSGFLSEVWVSSGTTTSSTVTVAGWGDGTTNYSRLIVFVTDSNGRVTNASVEVRGNHKASGGGGGGGGGDSP